MKIYLSSNLKILRRVFNLSAQDIADKTSLKRSSLASYETGRSYPRLDSLMEICTFFGVGFDLILTSKITEPAAKRAFSKAHEIGDLKGISIEEIFGEILALEVELESTFPALNTSKKPGEADSIVKDESMNYPSNRKNILFPENVRYLNKHLARENQILLRIIPKMLDSDHR